MAKFENDSLGARMKEYELTAQSKLLRRTPVIIRVDGRAFHTFTKKCEKPYDSNLHDAMCFAAQQLVDGIQGAVLAYTQSDEISILVRDWDSVKTSAFYDNNVQKFVSISAVIASNAFNHHWFYRDFVIGSRDNGMPAYKELAQFDARVYNLPKEEVCNYFIWRQMDATRNSINMLAQANFSHKQLQGKNIRNVQDMLVLEKGKNWNNEEVWAKRGSCAYKVERAIAESFEASVEVKDTAYQVRITPTRSSIETDRDIPIFTQDRNFIERFLAIAKEEE
jgi:tRNA(His) 5'-end guanylyltransferase